jgi:hypothetical protein
MEMIIDIVARIFVPIIGPVVASIIVASKGGELAENAVKTRQLHNIQKQVRELDYNDEEYAFIEKVLKEVYSKPAMRW